MEIIEQLRPVTFEWIAGGEADLGLVAEEVAKVAPLLTTRNAAGQIEGVKYDRINAVLVNAVQEQQAQIEELQARLAELEQGSAPSDPPASSSTPLVWLFIGILLLIVIAQSVFLWLFVAPRLPNRSTAR